MNKKTVGNVVGRMVQNVVKPIKRTSMILDLFKNPDNFDYGLKVVDGEIKINIKRHKEDEES
jgi:hypothetical protein